MYQIGDKNSDWEGVYVTGPFIISSNDAQMSKRALENEGWDADTPRTPTTDSQFNGVYQPDVNQVTIWCEVDEGEGDAKDGSTLEIKAGRELILKVVLPDLSIYTQTVVLQSAWTLTASMTVVASVIFSSF